MAIQFPETDKSYYLLISDPLIYAKAEQLGITAICYFEPQLDDTLLEKARNDDKDIVWIYYDTLKEEASWKHKYCRNGMRWIIFFNAYGNGIEGSPLTHSPAEAAEFLEKIIVSTEEYICGLNKVSDYKGKCGNCHSDLDDNDKYCRICGTKRGEGSFLPYFNETYFAYGPPIKMQIKCRKCGYTWETIVFGGDDSKYCPQCGKKNLKTMNREVLDFVEFLESDNQE